MKKIFLTAFIVASSLTGMDDDRMPIEELTKSPQTTVHEESPMDRSATDTTMHNPLMMLAAAAIAVAEGRTDLTPSTEHSAQSSLAAMLLARQDALLHELHSRYSVECSICHDTFITNEDLERHIAQFHDESLPYDCNICHCRFVTTDTLEEHVKITHGDTHPHMCRFCYQGFSTLEDLEDHQRHDHASSAASASKGQPSMETMDNALMPLTTAAAAVTTEKLADLAPTKLTSEPSSTSCYRPLHARIERMDKSESTAPFDRSCKCSQDKKDFICDVCHKCFARNADLKRHKDSVHEGKKDFKCDKCDKAFSSQRNLKRHINSVHEGKKDFTCTICHKNYSSKQYLKQHVASVHEGKKDFICDVCHKCFARNTHLKQHIASIHEGKKDFTCTICGKSFTQKPHLKRHVESVHEDKKDFSCDVCHKGFSYKKQLNDHLETRHNPSLPHDCPLCHQRFETEKQLKNHQYHAHTSSASSANAPIEFIDESSSISCYRPLRAKVHQTDLSHNTAPFVRTFECDDCGKELSSELELQKHLTKRHNQASLFDCPLCHQRFATKNQLEKHALQHKKDSDT